MKRAFLFFALLAGLSTAQAQTAPAPDFGGSILQMLFGLLLVLALLGGALWLLKRLATPPGGANALLRIVAGIAVGTRERVVIVETGDKWLILGVAPGRVSSLGEMPRQALPPAPAQTMPQDFAHWLKQTLERKRER